MQGRIWLYRGDRPVAAGPNQIHGDLFTHLTARLHAAPDAALDNLFPTHAAQADQLGGDGIIYQHFIDNTWHTMQTSSVAAPSGFARRWSGLIIPDGDNIPIQSFRLGHDLLAPDGSFTTQYASYSLPEAEVFFPDVPVTLVWETSLTRSA